MPNWNRQRDGNRESEYTTSYGELTTTGSPVRTSTSFPDVVSRTWRAWRCSTNSAWTAWTRTTKRT